MASKFGEMHRGFLVSHRKVLEKLKLPGSKMICTETTKLSEISCSQPAGTGAIHFEFLVSIKLPVSIQH